MAYEAGSTIEFQNFSGAQCCHYHISSYRNPESPAGSGWRTACLSYTVWCHHDHGSSTPLESLNGDGSGTTICEARVYCSSKIKSKPGPESCRATSSVPNFNSISLYAVNACHAHACSIKPALNSKKQTLLCRTNVLAGESPKLAYMASHAAPIALR